MIKRIQIKGTITETLIVQKEVSTYIDVDTESDESDGPYYMADNAIRKEAYKNTIQKYVDKHGWETIGTLDVNISSTFNLD